MILGNYGIGNLGDEVILDSMIAYLKSIHIEEIYVPTRNPKRLVRLHDNLNEYSMWSMPIKFISSDIIVLCGGGIVSQYSGQFIYMTLLLSVFGKMIFRKKIIIYSVGFSNPTPIPIFAFSLISWPKFTGNFAGITEQIYFQIIMSNFLYTKNMKLIC